MKLSAINTKALFKAFAQTVTVVSVLAAAGQAMAAPKAAAKKDPARDVIITLTNGRTSPVIFFTVIGADSQGQEDNLLKDALAPGKSVKVKAKGLKGRVWRDRLQDFTVPKGARYDVAHCFVSTFKYINTEAGAEIFKRADWGVVDDYKQVLRGFTERVALLRR